jgi:hypothetical protein
MIRIGAAGMSSTPSIWWAPSPSWRGRTGEGDTDTDDDDPDDPDDPDEVVDDDDDDDTDIALLRLL